MCPASRFGGNTTLPCGNGESGRLSGLVRPGAVALGDDEAWSRLCEWMGDEASGSKSAIRMKCVLFILFHLFEVQQGLVECADSHAHQIVQRHE